MCVDNCLYWTLRGIVGSRGVFASVYVPPPYKEVALLFQEHVSYHMSSIYSSVSMVTTAFRCPE